MYEVYSFFGFYFIIIRTLILFWFCITTNYYGFFYVNVYYVCIWPKIFNFNFWQSDWSEFIFVASYTDSVMSGDRAFSQENNLIVYAVETWPDR